MVKPRLHCSVVDIPAKHSKFDDGTWIMGVGKGLSLLSENLYLLLENIYVMRDETGESVTGSGIRGQ